MKYKQICVKTDFKSHDLTLNFDSKAILVISNLRCNIHTISNCCAKYEQPPSKNERGVHFTSSKTDFKNILP